MTFRAPYETHPRVQTGEPGLTMTKQDMQEECDINNILARYQKTGLMTHVKNSGGYQDLPSDVDYQTGLNVIIEAQASFDALPSSTRREFGNDPAAFLAFVEDPKNVARMADMGLLNAPPEALPTEVGSTPPVAASPAPEAPIASPSVDA